MRTTLLTFIGTSFILSMVVGCVPQQKYDDLLTAYRGKDQNSMKLQEELSASTANESLLRKQLTDARTYLDKLETMTSQQSSELANMESDFRSLSQRITSLRIAALPPELNAKLTQLRDAYPGVLNFDEATGMLEFNTDMSFGLGSAKLSSDAQKAMNSLASILNSSNGDGFDLDIIGHTDNVPVNRPSTKKLFPDNMHLSVGRAMAVRSQLVKDTVAGDRIKVGGWGEHRPVMTNPTRGGEPANRRVEIFLVPRSAEAMAVKPAGAPTTQQTSGGNNADQLDFPPK